jgi:hypothetical protein
VPLLSQFMVKLLTQSEFFFGQISYTRSKNTPGLSKPRGSQRALSARIKSRLSGKCRHAASWSAIVLRRTTYPPDSLYKRLVHRCNRNHLSGRHQVWAFTANDDDARLLQHLVSDKGVLLAHVFPRYFLTLSRYDKESTGSKKEDDPSHCPALA